MTKTERDIQRKLRVLRHATQINEVSKACRYFGVARASFYRWKSAYERHGDGHIFENLDPRNPTVLGRCVAGFGGKRARGDDIHGRTVN